MTLESALAFAGLCLLLSISPGPDSLLVLRLSLIHVQDGIAVAVGSALGSLVWAAAVAFGLARVLASHPGLVEVLHVIGGVYLIHLGFRELIDSHSVVSPAEPPARGRSGFTQGLVSCILNPKVGLFFLFVAPQYAPTLSVQSILTLGAIDAAVAALWLTLLAVAAARIFQRITRPSTQRRLRVGSGAAIALVGLFVLLSAIG